MERNVAVKFFRSLENALAWKEIEVLFELRHPNIVGILAWFSSIKDGHDRVGIILELCQRGKLSDVYTKDWFTSEVALKVMSGSARAVSPP